MSCIKYYLEKEYIEEKTSTYYGKKWITSIIVTGGKFFDISRKKQKEIETEEIEITLGIPKYEQIALDDF